MEQLRAVQRRQASRARHQQHSSDQRSRRLASYGHHGAGRVGHCAAAQGISTVREARLGGSMMGATLPIGFIGLGTMGEAMALTLVKAGARLLVWNRTRAKAEILAAAGADVAREAADVFAHSEIVFLMLVDGGAIDTVLDRGGAAFDAPATGQSFVHMGTRSPGLFGSARGRHSLCRGALRRGTGLRPPWPTTILE